MNNQLMNTERQAMPQPLALSGTGPRRPPDNPLLLIRRYLRGRYLLAAALGALLSVPGALVGYSAVPPVYESTGIVHVAPRMPKVLYENEENRPMASFDSFVAAQATYLKSRRVLDLAVSNEKLLAAGWPAGSAGLSSLQGMDVETPRGSELVIVTIKHRQPALAQLAVSAVLDAYDTLKDELNGIAVESRETVLVQRAKDLDLEVKSLRQQALQLAQVHGTDDLDALHTMKTEAIARLESSIAELDLQITRAGAVPGRAGPDADPKPEGEQLDIIALAARDQTLHGLVEQQDRLRLESKSLSGKLSPAHPTMMDLARRLEAIDEEVLARAELVAKQPRVGPGLSGVGPAVPLAQLQISRDGLVKLRDKALDEMKAIGATRMSILSLRERAADRKHDLDETNTGLDQMRVERLNTKTGRVTIAQRGDLPVSPSTDRRMPLAMFGALFGLGLGVGGVWAYGFLRDGYRYVDDLETTGYSPPLLGIIPELSDDDPERSEDAALSVHHIRNMLQFQAAAGGTERGTAFAVTSSMAGDGKTHLAMALGLSFAMSGRRTLLIDADLRGRGLTAQLGLERSKGLSEAIHATTLNGDVHSAGPNLSAIPAGTVEGFRPEQLSSVQLARVLDRARESFDTIIVDTGPISGSLEANLAASLCDRVVLVVSRGQDPKVVQAALNRLKSIGATCAGMVFNRATATDFAKSASGLSTSRRISRVAPAPAASSKAIDLAKIMEKNLRADADSNGHV